LRNETRRHITSVIKAAGNLKKKDPHIQKRALLRESERGSLLKKQIWIGMRTTQATERRLPIQFVEFTTMMEETMRGLRGL
jgi:hypothetical protein